MKAQVLPGVPLQELLSLGPGTRTLSFSLKGQSLQQLPRLLAQETLPTHVVSYCHPLCRPPCYFIPILALR